MVSQQVREQIRERLGQTGLDWLDGIPARIDTISKEQNLNVLSGPLHEGTMSVAFLVDTNQGRGVLKFPSPDAQSNEVLALRAWQNNHLVGSVITDGEDFIITKWVDGARPKLSTVPAKMLGELLLSLRTYEPFDTSVLETDEQRVENLFR